MTPPTITSRPHRHHRKAPNLMTGVLLATLTSLSGPVHAVVVPHATNLALTQNWCSEWSGDVTFTAEPPSAEDDVLIRTYSNYDYGHLHYGDKGFVYSTHNTFSSDDYNNRVAQINQLMFNTSTPAPGATTTIFMHHSGGCATAAGGYECVGVFVSNTVDNILPAGVEPLTLGRCIRVPNRNGSCWFNARTLNKDVGTITAEGASSRLDLQYQCSGTAPDYRLSLQGGGSSVLDSGAGVSVAIKVRGVQLPFTIAKPGAGIGSIPLELTTAADPSSSGKFSASGVLILEPN